MQTDLPAAANQVSGTIFLIGVLLLAILATIGMAVKRWGGGPSRPASSHSDKADAAEPSKKDSSAPADKKDDHAANKAHDDPHVKDHAHPPSGWGKTLKYIVLYGLGIILIGLGFIWLWTFFMSAKGPVSGDTTTQPPANPNGNPPKTDFGLPEVESSPSTALYSSNTALEFFQHYGVMIVGAIALIILLILVWKIKKEVVIGILTIIVVAFLLLEPPSFWYLKSEFNKLITQGSYEVSATGDPQRIGTFKVGQTPVSIPKRTGYCVRPSGAGSNKVEATADTSTALVYYIARGATEVKVDFAWFPLNSTQCR